MLWYRRSYRHEPLNQDRQEIRLLRLLPELDKDGLIQCDISTYDLALAPGHQALSYEWGPPEPVRKVSISGKILIVRENLWLFLDMFRTNTANDTLLWIDQICIDQQNTPERGHQVKLMGEIYSEAIRAVVWLGPSTDVNTDISTTFKRHGDLLLPLLDDDEIPEEEKIFMMADDVVKDAEMTVPRPWSEQQCTEDRCALCCWYQKGIGRRERDREKASDEKLMLKDMSELTYWTRLWIIQENVLAHDCVFFLGQLYYSRYEIRRYAQLQRVVSTSPFVGSYPRTIAHILLLTRYDRSDDVLSLELAFQQYGDHDHGVRYSDARDLVYGILGLVKPEDRPIVDYKLDSIAVFECLMNKVILSPTLNVNQRGSGGPQLSPNLAYMGQKLGVSATWVYWLNSAGCRRNICEPIEEFLYCLTSLESLGLQKLRWTHFELGSIVHAARKMEHILLPSESWNPHKLYKVLPSPAGIDQCAKFVNSINDVAGPDLPRLLLKMELSSYGPNTGRSLLKWTRLFYLLDEVNSQAYHKGS